ncbi:sugar phosphate isomerase/epimerase family protein [Oenococcus oeni]|uniref:Sugar phosphate isomerase/epimerase n=6 Tax=Oenococcus oeni TaxID=1247 RepID=Q04HF0_OENOB|nr:sugar phosphate isomerase/epimerase [Oenococcus oeni]ABJ56122.1 Sugar phosphate isomerase/epimerase [Oenococcus oeni PSU-1]AWW98670.1 sugar phosphate isomerase/epimerase [Oenococcus oeni]EFD89457.1 hypothetical protein AWRIB429_0105 [Oenococcus oeni AWRIB429]EJN91407.1 sugar phosphate isomerase/epimerase [Oenococcus oeni AWRIB304]EJO02925.1 sugar phosphate isomerase/epimerase [Oenococcus oeni AWRIB318]
MAIFLNTLIFADRIKNGEKQIDLLDEIKQAGADGVEARYEYFKDFDAEAPLIKERAKKLNLQISLSIPDELFEDNGGLNKQLPEYYRQNLLLGSKRAKFNTGNFSAFNGNLKENFSNIPNGLQLDVENDQTELSGHIENILPFLKSVQQAGLNIAFVYDLGNWAYTKGDAIENAKKLAPYTEYIHFKNVKGTGDKLITTEDLDDGRFDWKKIADILPKNVDSAIEFSIDSDEKIASQVKLLKGKLVK